MNASFIYVMLLILGPAFAQGQCETSECQTPDQNPDYFYPEDAPKNTVKPNELFVIESGTYAGNPDIMPNAIVWVKAGAQWISNKTPNQLKGRLIIQGTVTFPRINESNPTHTSIEICSGGRLSIHQDLDLHFAMNIHQGGQLNIQGKLNYAQHASLKNSGHTDIEGSVLFHTATPLVNCSGSNFKVSGSIDLQSGQALINRGIFEINQQVSLHSGADFENTCSFVVHGSMNTEGNHINNGTIYVKNEQETASMQQLNGHLTNNNIIVADNLDINGTLTGSKSLIYIEKQSSMNGTLGGSMNIYDHSKSSGSNQYFDQEQINVTGQIAKEYIEIPDKNDLLNCARAADYLGTALPVTWLDFNGQQKEEYISLEWITASEHHNEFFDLQRFDDFEDRWNSICTIPAENIEKLATYRSFDKNPRDGTNLYRVKQVDSDGTYSYSDWIIVQFEHPTSYDPQFTVFPNPTYGALNVFFLSRSDQIARIDIYSKAGRLSTSFTIHFTEGMNQVELPDQSQLANGAYFVLLFTEDGQRFERKMIKRSY